MTPASGAAGTLYLIATPIGNLEDITLRALRVLKEVQLVAAEDTRRTLQLLNHFQISQPLFSYYKDVEHTKTQELIARLERGDSVALVTDAGTPAVSDPGVVLVQAAIQAGIKVEVIPGASALLVALLGAGLDTGAFTFSGFLEARPADRKKQLQAWKDRRETQVVFVSPHQVRAAVKDVLLVWGDRPAVLARELTKLHEEYIRGSLSEIVERLAEQDPRGEYTLVVSGSTRPETAPVMDESLEAHLARLQGEGFSLNQAVARVARERGMARAEVYARAHGSAEKSVSDGDSE